MVLSNAREMRPVLLRRWWLRDILKCTNLPVPVARTRLAVPLWVFSLYFFTVILCCCFFYTRSVYHACPAGRKAVRRIGGWERDSSHPGSFHHVHAPFMVCRLCQLTDTRKQDHAPQEGLQIDRLYHVIICTGLEASNLILDAGSASDTADGHISESGRLAQLLDQHLAVTIWHINFQQEDRRTILRDHLHGF